MNSKINYTEVEMGVSLYMFAPKIRYLAEIISDYRQYDSPVKMSNNHVQRWIDQFPYEKQDTILSESIFILSKWFFNMEQIRQFLREVFEKVHKRILYHLKG